MITEQEILDELEKAIQNTNRSNDDLLRVLESDEETDVTLRDGEVVPSLDKRVDLKVKAIGEDYIQQLDEVIIDLENKSTVELQELEDAINTIVVDNGVPDSVVVTWSGRTQEEENKAFITTVNYLADLDAMPKFNGRRATVLSYSADVQSEPMLYVYDASRASENNNGTIYKGWVAQLKGYVTPEMFGVQEGIDQTTALKSCLQFAMDNEVDVIAKSGRHYYSNTLSFSNIKNSLKIKSSGTSRAVFHDVSMPAVNDDTERSFFNFKGDYSVKVNVVEESNRGARTLKVEDASKFSAGDLVLIRTNKLYESDNRGWYCEGEHNLIQAINLSTNTLYFEMPLHNQYFDPYVINGVLTEVVDAWTFKLDGNANKTSQEAMVDISINGASVANRLSKFNPETKLAELNSTWRKGFPDAVVGDTYTLSYQATVTKVTNASVVMEGIEVTRPLNTTNQGNKYKGINIEWLPNSKVNDCKVTNFSYANIMFRCCYKIEACNNILSGSNNFDLGYGVQVIDTSYSLVDNNTITNTRCGVDIFGVSSISWNNIVSRNTTIGGGVDNHNRLTFPFGTGTCRGVGSHGGAFGTLYESNITIDTEYAIGIRGNNETMINNQHRGIGGERLINIRYGGNHTVDGFRYYDSYSERNVTQSDLVSPRPTIASNRPNPAHMVFLECDLLNPNKSITILNCHAENITRYAVYLNNNAIKVMPTIRIGNVHACISNSEDTGTVAGLFGFNSSKTLNISNKLVDMGGNGITIDGVYESQRLYPIGRNSNFSVDVNTFHKIQGSQSFSAVIGYDKAIRIPLVESGAGIILTIIDPDSTNKSSYFCSNLYLRNASTVEVFPATYKGQNLEVSSVPLTGQTGSAGSVTVSYVAGSLYIENRFWGVGISPTVIISGA